MKARSRELARHDRRARGPFLVQFCAGLVEEARPYREREPEVERLNRTVSPR
jgi:hypothetical protein